MGAEMGVSMIGFPHRLATVVALAVGLGCTDSGREAPTGEAGVDAAPLDTVGDAAGAGRILRLQPGFDALVPPGATIEKLADGFVFVEGPVWDSRTSRLYFSDIPGNTIYTWSEADSVQPFVESWYDGSMEERRSWGPNGLTFDAQGRLIVSDHGRRQITRIEPDGSYTAVAAEFEGLRLNSPNDVVIGSDGTLYFTDPPFGLAEQDTSTLKELAFNGVYRLTPAGSLEVISREQSRPNGIVLSPDESTLYVSNADAAHAAWIAYELSAAGVINSRVFFDATGQPGMGLPDGLKVDREGNLFATGPGGVWVFGPDATHLGTISVEEAPANLAWGDDGNSLYFTARRGLYRIRLTTGGQIP